jgi:hypothetical protein
MQFCVDHTNRLRSAFRRELKQQESKRIKELDEQRRRASVVYVMWRMSDGLVKIGYSTDVGKRLQALRTQHGSLDVLFTFPGGREVERQHHERFAVHRVKGEWFRPEGELQKWIDDVTARRTRDETVAS